MKITQKTYLLLGIIIGVSAINLVLLLSISQENLNVLHSISDASDLKVIIEGISGTANSIASGNNAGRQTLADEINGFNQTYEALGTGGTFRGIQIVSVPSELRQIYNRVGISWQKYNHDAAKIQKESVFDPTVEYALAYILGKNGNLISLTDGVVNDLAPLGMNYDKHKMIAAEMVGIAQDIGQKTLLISIGEGRNSTDAITKDRITFDGDLKNLEGIPLDHPDYAKYGIVQENLQKIPRENSYSLRHLDPLWDAERAKIEYIENNTLISKDFGSALVNLDNQRGVLLGHVSQFVDDWNKFIDSELKQNVTLVQGLLIVDIVVFVTVMLTIRKSLNPLHLLINAIGRIREGFYGEKIDYVSNDEIGNLAEAINSMSGTIQKKEEESKKIEIAKNEFLAMITHELKTPLVPIQGFSDMLLGEHLGSLNENQKDRLKIIRSSADSLLQLISDLLDAQKLELDQLKIKKTNNDLKETIETAIESMQSQALADQIKLTHNLNHSIYASYDNARMIQVLTNLIKNSLKAVMSKVGKIEILAEENSKEVIVSVKDNGKGIPDNVIGNLFKKFYQVDTSSTREFGGSGLGLSICRGIVESHGGRIWVQSKVKEGSTFSFTIPKNESSKMPL